MAEGAVFASRVRLQNYKSIKACDVRLGPLSVLVGPNGSGKSNFLDALRFTADALTTTLDHAMRDRGGINEVRRRSGGHPTHFAIRLDVNLPDGRTGHYAYKVGAQRDGGFSVTDEECLIRSAVLGESDTRFRVKGGSLETSLTEMVPDPVDDRLYLVAASGIRAFRPMFDSLTSMGFYNLNPAAIRQLQQPDAGALLRRDGSNLASVLGHLARHNGVVLERVVDYLKLVAPGVEGVEQTSAGPMETIAFRQQVLGQQKSWRFGAANMSDGTLRGLGVLVAILQANGRRPSLIGIEEPEVALHPTAVGVLIDALTEASRDRQLVVTSHSPELLDRDDLDPDSLLAVIADQGVTAIGPINDVGRAALKDRLFNAGELLRLNQLAPSDETMASSRSEQLHLFDR
jgi:predicted ATPase